MSVRAMRRPPLAASECAQQFKIVEELRARAVGGKRLGELFVALREGEGRDREDAVMAVLSRLLEGALNARLNADDEAAIVLELVLRAEDLRFRRVHLGDVVPAAVRAARR